MLIAIALVRRLDPCPRKSKLADWIVGTVTIYTDNDCSNNLVLAPLSSCITMDPSINSLSVDCKLPDGSWESANLSQTASFSYAGGSSIQATASGLSSSSPSSLPSSASSVSSIPPVSSSSPATFSTAKVSSSSSSSAKPTGETSILSSPSLHLLTTSSSSSSASTGTTSMSIMSPIAYPTSTVTMATPPPSSTTATDQGGGNRANSETLSTNAQIAIGVVVPAVSAVVAVVFGLRMWNRKG